MKILFFIILSLNALVFIWEMNTSRPVDSDSIVAAQPEIETIKLLDELELGDVVLNPNSLKEPERCYFIGPFNDQRSAQSWLGRFTNQFKVLQISSKLVKSKKEYQLYIQAADSAELAEQYAEKLRAQGISDFSVAANWEILLAWYKDPLEAETERLRLHELGWNSQTRTRELLVRQFFVKLSVTGSADGNFLQKRNWPTEFQQADIKLLPMCLDKNEIADTGQGRNGM